LVRKNHQMKVKVIIASIFLLIFNQTKAQKMNIEVDPTASCYSKEEILINSPVEVVFKIISDIKNWPSWQSSVTLAEITGPVQAGAQFKWKAGGLNINSKLHTVNTNSEIGWTGKIWWIKAVHNWYLRNENQKTKVIVEESLTGPGSSLMQKSLIEGMKRNLSELKAKAESI